MDEGTVSETVPDLKDIEVKIGRKTPEGLLRWMREEASSFRGDARMSAPQEDSKETGMMSLDEKIRKLKVEMVSVCGRAWEHVPRLNLVEAPEPNQINDKLVSIK